MNTVPPKLFLWKETPQKLYFWQKEYYYNKVPNKFLKYLINKMLEKTGLNNKPVPEVEFKIYLNKEYKDIFE